MTNYCMLSITVLYCMSVYTYKIQAELFEQFIQLSAMMDLAKNLKKFLYSIIL